MRRRRPPRIRMVREKKPKTGEAAVKESIMEYLAIVKRWKVWRRNVGGVTREYKGKKRFIKFGATGQSDCWGLILPGARHFEIEVKKPGEEPTGTQYEWLDEIRAAGGVALWVDSLEMLEAKLKDLGL